MITMIHIKKLKTNIKTQLKRRFEKFLVNAADDDKVYWYFTT